MDRKNPPEGSQEGDLQRNDEEEDCQIAEEEEEQAPRLPPSHQLQMNEEISHLASCEPQRQQPQDAQAKKNRKAKNRRIRSLSDVGKLPPPLPETIEFVPHGAGTSSAHASSGTAEQQYRQLHPQTESSQQYEHPTGLTGNEFLMDSIFMLLYLRRSTSMIPISIPLLHSTDHPILLTLASYPFRVLFSNDAHQNLRGSTNTVGSTLFECFESDEDVMNPSLSSYPEFLKLILDGRPCYINTKDRDGRIQAKVCTIKAEEVYSKKGEDEALQYYAIHFIVAT